MSLLVYLIIIFGWNNYFIENMKIYYKMNCHFRMSFWYSILCFKYFMSTTIFLFAVVFTILQSYSVNINASFIDILKAIPQNAIDSIRNG